MGFANGITQPFKVIEPHDFDTFDEGVMHDVVAVPRLIVPVTDLCQLAEQLERSAGSFGVDYTKLGEQAAPMLLALLKACREEWKDQ